MKKFKNSFDYSPVVGEVNELPSLTVPDMTMSLAEILRRYTRGGEVATFQPVYQDGDDFDDSPDVSKMDAPEKLQYALDLKAVIKRKQREMKERKMAKNVTNSDKTNDTDSVKKEPDKKEEPVGSGTSNNSP